MRAYTANEQSVLRRASPISNTTWPATRDLNFCLPKLELWRIFVFKSHLTFPPIKNGVILFLRHGRRKKKVPVYRLLEKSRTTTRNILAHPYTHELKGAPGRATPCCTPPPLGTPDYYCVSLGCWQVWTDTLLLFINLLLILIFLPRLGYLYWYSISYTVSVATTTRSRYQHA